MLLIMAAFKAELQAFQGSLGDLDISTAVTGMGKIPALLSAEKLIERMRPSHVIFCGIAGGAAEDVTIGDLVISDAVIEYDVLQWKETLMPQGTGAGGFPEESVRTDAVLTSRLAEAADKTCSLRGSGRVFRGITGTADLVLDARSYPLYKALLETNSVLSVDMEGYSAALSAQRLGIPFSQIRFISDTFRDKPAVSFRNIVKEASSLLRDVICSIDWD